MSTPETNPRLFIVGHTGSHKSAAAMQIAEALPSPLILSLDQGAAWCGMDEGTAKATQQDRQRIEHALVDVFDLQYVGMSNTALAPYPSQSLAISLGEMAQLAFERVDGDNGQAIGVGGSPFLYKFAYNGYEFGPPIAADSYATLSQLSSNQLRRLLTKHEITLPFNDSDDEADRRELLERAIRVAREPEVENPYSNVSTIGLCLDNNDKLETTIRDRTDRMIQSGLVNEVTNLVEEHGWKWPLRQAIGYREFQQFVGGLSLDKVIEAINTHTIVYARRQRAAFWKHPEIQWVSSVAEAVDVGLSVLSPKT